MYGFYIGISIHCHSWLTEKSHHRTLQGCQSSSHECISCGSWSRNVLRMLLEGTVEGWLQQALRDKSTLISGLLKLIDTFLFGILFGIGCRVCPRVGGDMGARPAGFRLEAAAGHRFSSLARSLPIPSPSFHLHLV